MLRPLLGLLAVCIGACAAPLGADGPAPACPTPDCSACPGAPRSTPFVALGAAQSPTHVGAAQGVDVRDGFVYVFGDDDVGVIAELAMGANGVAIETGTRARLTREGADIIPHPTGLTHQPMVGTFVGNSLRNVEGRIFELDWEQLLITGSLDNALLHEVLDDLSAAGSRPELVQTSGTWLVASADYTEGLSRVRLYDPVALRSAARTSAPGVLVTSFEAGEFVQSMQFNELEGSLILIRNPERGHGWIVEKIDLDASIAAGQAQVLWTYNPDETGELEGFHSLGDARGIFVTSSPTKSLRVGRLCEAN